MSRAAGRICRRLKADSGLIRAVERGPEGPLYPGCGDLRTTKPTRPYAGLKCLREN